VITIRLKLLKSVNPLTMKEKGLSKRQEIPLRGPPSPHVAGAKTEWKVYLCGFLSGSLGPPRHSENNA
jgi:hypothetical protein